MTIEPEETLRFNLACQSMLRACQALSVASQDCNPKAFRMHSRAARQHLNVLFGLFDQADIKRLYEQSDKRRAPKVHRPSILIETNKLIEVLKTQGTELDEIDVIIEDLRGEL